MSDCKFATPIDGGVVKCSSQYIVNDTVSQASCNTCPAKNKDLTELATKILAGQPVREKKPCGGCKDKNKGVPVWMRKPEDLL
jgi:hypothetical protein